MPSMYFSWASLRNIIRRRIFPHIYGHPKCLFCILIGYNVILPFWATYTQPDTWTVMTDLINSFLKASNVCVWVLLVLISPVGFISDGMLVTVTKTYWKFLLHRNLQNLHHLHHRCIFSHMLLSIHCNVNLCFA